jgi:Sec-independent protein translocase protein TatA
VTLAFFEIGFGEMVVVAFIALLLFGGDLPRVMRSLGTMYRGFRKNLDDLKVQAMRPDLMTPTKPATRSTPYRPASMPLPPPAGVSLTPPAMPSTAPTTPAEAVRGLEPAAPATPVAPMPAPRREPETAPPPAPTPGTNVPQRLPDDAPLV